MTLNKYESTFTFKSSQIYTYTLQDACLKITEFLKMLAIYKPSNSQAKHGRVLNTVSGQVRVNCLATSFRKVIKHAKLNSM